MNTILRGHQGARALLLNGETETKVLVRYDLADADGPTIEREFLEDNQNRRQQSPLEQGRVFLRLFEIDKKAKPGKLARYQELKARDLLCAKLGMNRRNVDRYLRILKTPIEVQHEFEAERISLVLAGQVAGLDAATQEKIAKRIREGEKAKDVLTSFLGKKMPVTANSTTRISRSRNSSRFSSTIWRTGCTRSASCAAPRNAGESAARQAAPGHAGGRGLRGR